MGITTRDRLHLMLGAALGSLARPSRAAAPRWSPQQARAWQKERGWLVGCNFIPSTAINQLEMWQAESFDAATIDRELGWAEQLGFTSVRVFLHNLTWARDPEGFARRIDQFLGIAARHKIGAMLVLFDSCWDPFPQLGPQRAPKPQLHNSGWVQAPGHDILRDPGRHDSLKGYVQGVLQRFAKDARIHAWDLMNEPDNTNGNSYGEKEPPGKPELAFALLRKTFDWAREVNPSQPLTAAPWLGDWSSPEKMKPIDRFMFEQSDVVTYHNYANLAEMKRRVGWLQGLGRPMLCTEYMARPVDSTFFSILPYLRDQGVGAYNWGFVDGKTQTIYPWDSWQKQYNGEPPLWFHDIFRRDGAAYDPAEVDLIRRLTGRTT